jgi:hypothetical protein
LAVGYYQLGQPHEIVSGGSERQSLSGAIAAAGDSLISRSPRLRTNQYAQDGKMDRQTFTN